EHPPPFLACAPYDAHGERTIREELIAAGFGSVSIEMVAHTTRARPPREPALAFCQGTPLRNEIEARDASALEAATAAAADALRQRFGDGAIEGRMRAFVIAAAS